jgi:hypothetical protein
LNGNALLCVSQSVVSVVLDHCKTDRGKATGPKYTGD